MNLVLDQDVSGLWHLLPGFNSRLWFLLPPPGRWWHHCEWKCDGYLQKHRLPRHSPLHFLPAKPPFSSPAHSQRDMEHSINYSTHSRCVTSYWFCPNNMFAFDGQEVKSGTKIDAVIQNTNSSKNWQGAKLWGHSVWSVAVDTDGSSTVCFDTEVCWHIGFYLIL